MKKYNVAVIITTRKTIFYEVYAEKHSDIYDEFFDDPTEDLGRLVDETASEIVDREIGYIDEVKND